MWHSFMQVRLLHGVLPLLTKREVSLSRRIYSWLLGTSDETGASRAPFHPASSPPGRPHVLHAPPRPHLRRGWACPGPYLHCKQAQPGHICTGTGLAPVTSAPGLGSPLPHLHRGWAHPRRSLCN